ncbi:ATP-dependent DNA helicase DinG [Methanococcus voltae]|nr:ATP-dependent DNA helicase DinG [Methanococcus voltae]
MNYNNNLDTYTKNSNDYGSKSYNSSKNYDFYEFKEYINDKFPYNSMRPQQITFMENIYNCIVNNRKNELDNALKSKDHNSNDKPESGSKPSNLKIHKNLVVEAPTGVGKTLSYLIPSLYFAERGNRIIILTETIDQQERILEDLNSLKHDLKVSFMMGKGNFFCKSKGDKANRLYCQLNRHCRYRPNRKPICECGTKKEELRLNDDYVRYYCPICACEYQKVKIDCLDADIVIMNNSIYYYLKEEIDKKKKTNIVIVDEAHKLEGSIRNSATITINPKMALGRLRYMAYNYAPLRIRKAIDRYGYGDEGASDKQFWEIIENYVHTFGKDKDFKQFLVHNGEKITSFGMKEDVAILGTLLEGYYEISDIQKKIKKFEENVELDRKDFKFKIENNALIPLELQFITEKRINDMPLSDFIDDVMGLRNVNSNYVIYRNENKVLCEPVLVSSILKNLYDGASVIHCSATLGDLNVHGMKTGMGKTTNLILDSPFSKERRKIIALSDGVDMKFKSRDDNITNRKNSNENLYNLVKACNGNTLILFKSFGDLNSAYNYFLMKGYKNNIHCYQQGMDGKEAKKLKSDFEKYGGLLLATGRFAEGVDIPGEALTAVIIDSLPFPVPTPLLNKEQSLIENKLQRRVPNAHWRAFLMTSFHIMSRTVVQMIGRLIRTEEDYGVVVVQDRRFAEWVGKEMVSRKYLKNGFMTLTKKDAINFIPEFMNKYR